MIKRISLVLVLFGILLSSCVVEETVVPTTVSTETPMPTATLVPTETLMPTPTAIPMASGAVTGLQESDYVVVEATDKFPLNSGVGMPGIKEIAKSTLSYMYKSSKYTENGFEITTGNGDIITITNTEFVGNGLMFHFLRNGIQYATIKASLGTLLGFGTCLPDTNLCGEKGYGIAWGVYDPTNQRFLGLFETLDGDETVPISVLQTIDKEWTPILTLIPEKIDICKANNPIVANHRTRDMTYKLNDNLVVRWGSPPLPCPTIEISYP